MEVEVEETSGSDDDLMVSVFLPFCAICILLGPSP
jgi:hypothetical protein